jgi:hypothetical protein
MRRRTAIIVLVLATALGSAAIGSLAFAQGGGNDFAGPRLIGYSEVPAVSTTARGRFDVSFQQGQLHYTLRYRDLEAPVTQAHIHFGQREAAGGISAFLCSNLGNGPEGTPACRGPTEGEVSGTIGPDQVVGPANQGIAAGEFAELFTALRNNRTYANVHSEKFPGGEIRAQIVPGS